MFFFPPRFRVLSLALADEQRVGFSINRDKESENLENTIHDQHPLAEADGARFHTMFPSPRCANREERQEGCRLWSGKTHHRYLVFKDLRPRGGVGVSLMRVAWALNRAISFDLEPVFVGPLLTAHGVGDFGDWMGLTHNPMLEIQDPGAFQRATHESVPFPQGDGDAWFREQENRTSVVYEADAMKANMLHDWGIPVSIPSSDASLCLYARYALRDIYWGARQIRGRCAGFLPEDHLAPPQVVLSRARQDQPQRNRSWVVAVHVRRGDIIHFRSGFRSIPHSYFSAAVRAVLQGIAVSDPAATVSVLVFSEGPNTMKRLQLPDEHGKPFTWDIERESCVDVGLTCSQVRGIKAQGGATTRATCAMLG